MSNNKNKITTARVEITTDDDSKKEEKEIRCKKIDDYIKKLHKHEKGCYKGNKYTLFEDIERLPEIEIKHTNKYDDFSALCDLEYALEQLKNKIKF